ncbi:hypothetical protein KPL70_007243 [Citrus sinensis]|nr:hypothetical protein KPL70_007243 [Citrus sinensis]
MFSLRMIEGASLNEHIDEFNKVCDELETIDEGLSDESKALLLISSLPKSYEHFVDALLYGRQTLSLEEVKSALGTTKLKDKQDNPESESSIKQNGLYVLDGHTAVGEVSLTDSGGNKSMLWHLRMGHMSERELSALKSKDEVLEKFKIWKIFVENQTGLKVKTLRTDNGLEYCNKLFEEFCEKNGRMVDYSKLRIFGCTAYAHVKQGKLEPRALKCRFLGYPEGIKGYRLWCVDSKPLQCMISRDVTFHEDEILDNSKRPVNNSKSESEEDTYQLARDRKRRTIRPPKRYAIVDLTAYALTAAQELNNDEPRTYQEAITGKNKLWDTGAQPRRFKAKLVARGFIQKEGIDFIELFSPVVRHASIRIILALVAVQDMHLEQMYVKTTFLHGELQEEIVIQQPEGCNYDCCVYFKETSGGGMIYLLLYVDDMLIACHDREEINHLKRLLSRKFEMKELGKAKRILKMDIIRNRSKKILFLTQQSYIKKVVVRFGMNDAKQVQTPLANHFKLSAVQCPQTEAKQ